MEYLEDTVLRVARTREKLRKIGRKSLAKTMGLPVEEVDKVEKYLVNDIVNARKSGNFARVAAASGLNLGTVLYLNLVYHGYSDNSKRVPRKPAAKNIKNIEGVTRLAQEGYTRAEIGIKLGLSYGDINQIASKQKLDIRRDKRGEARNYR